MEAGLAAELPRLLDDDPPTLFDADAFGDAAFFTDEDFFVLGALVAVAGLELLAVEDARFAAGLAAAGSRFEVGALFDTGTLFGEGLFVEALLVAVLFGAALLRLEVRLGAALFADPVLREDAPAGATVNFFFGELLVGDVFDVGAEEDRAGEELLVERLDDEPAEEPLLFWRGFSSSTRPTFSATDFTASLITCVTLPATSLTVSVTLSSALAIGDAADRDFLAAIILSSTVINSICRSHHHCLQFPHHPDERTTSAFILK